MSKSKEKKPRRKEVAATVSSPVLNPGGLVPPALIVLLFSLGIFFLPYHLPPRIPSDSQSWEFGFNNTIAQAFIALMLLALFSWQLFAGRVNLKEDLIANAVAGEPKRFAVRPLLYTMCILQLFSAAILSLWYSLLPMTHYGEFTYFIQRIEAVILGGKPYVDFAFDYGPAMLALPVGIYHAFHGMISVEDAYAATVIIHFTAGYGLLAYIVSQINTRGRVILIAMNGFHFINITLGLNYTPLRFTIALASLFGVRHLYRATQDSPKRRMILLGIAGFLLPLISFSISPEMGLALSVSLTVYFLWFLLGSERRLSFLALSVVAGVFATAFWFPRPYFNSMLSFGKGGANFPIFPTVHILAFLAAAIWVFPRLGIIAVRDKTAAAPFCAGLAFLCGLFILPATGRCDPGHIWLNSFSLLIVALAAASWLRPKWWYTIWIGYFLVFPLFDEVSFWENYALPIQNVLTIRSQLTGVRYDADNYHNLKPGIPLPPIHYSKLLPSAGLESFPQGKIGLPLGDNEVMERFFKLTGRYVPEYHIAPYGDVFDSSDLDRKYSDMREMQYLFIPLSELNYLSPMDIAAQMRAQGEADDEFLSSLLLFPVNLIPIHPLFKADSVIMKHIQAGYYLVQRYQNGVLLKRKN